MKEFKFIMFGMKLFKNFKLCYIIVFAKFIQMLQWKDDLEAYSIMYLNLIYFYILFLLL
jgi:hypothetical protein